MDGTKRQRQLLGAVALERAQDLCERTKKATPKDKPSNRAACRAMPQLVQAHLMCSRRRGRGQAPARACRGGRR